MLAGALPIAHPADVLSLAPIHGFIPPAALLLDVSSNIPRDRPAEHLFHLERERALG